MPQARRQNLKWQNGKNRFAILLFIKYLFTPSLLPCTLPVHYFTILDFTI